MRLVSAILVLLVSIGSLATGIALRTVWAGPDEIVRSVSIDHTAPVVLIDGSALSAYPGRQTITVVDENQDPTSDVTLVYGRSADVIAWVRPARFMLVRHNQETGELYAVSRLGAESEVPDPIGSDLWLEQYREPDALQVSLTASEGITVAVMANGSSPAPGSIQLRWPLDNVSPIAGLLVALGLILMAIGFLLLLFAIADLRRRRGPRRKTTVTPKRRAPSRRSFQPRSSRRGSARGRRVARRQALALPVLGVLLATGCVPSAAPPETATPEDAVETPAQPAAPAAYPAVTEQQFERIMQRVANQVSLADQSLDAELLVDRVAEPTISHRKSQYVLRNFDDDLGQILRIPAEPVRVLVPQQTTEWPRFVVAVMQEGIELNSPTLAVVLRQENPRDNYRMLYATLLAPDIVLPAMPTANVGSPRLARDSKLVAPNPEDTVTLYADVLRRGPEGRGWAEFDTLTDNLYSLVGPEGQALRRESLGSDLDISTKIQLTDFPIIALATADNGALVFGTIREEETVRPIEEGATINATPSIRAMTSIPQSTEGFVALYDMQIVWYVPPVGSDERAKVVGYGYMLVDANELESDTEESTEDQS